jgi:hypothetical protein
MRLCSVLVGFTLLVLWGSACGGTARDQPASLLPTPTASVEDVFSGFDSTEFASVGEASSVAGFSIPTPSDEFTSRHGFTLLRGSEGGGFLSSTHYISPTSPNLALRLDVADRSAWLAGALERGDATNIGTHAGRLSRAEQGGYIFSFPCVTANSDIYCIAFADSRLPSEEFERFVASIR